MHSPASNNDKDPYQLSVTSEPSVPPHSRFSDFQTPVEWGLTIRQLLKSALSSKTQFHWLQITNRIVTLCMAFQKPINTVQCTELYKSFWCTTHEKLGRGEGRNPPYIDWPNMPTRSRNNSSSDSFSHSLSMTIHDLLYITPDNQSINEHARTGQKVG